MEAVNHVANTQNLGTSLCGIPGAFKLSAELAPDPYRRNPDPVVCLECQGALEIQREQRFKAALAALPPGEATESGGRYAHEPPPGMEYLAELAALEKRVGELSARCVTAEQRASMADDSTQKLLRYSRDLEERLADVNPSDGMRAAQRVAQEKAYLSEIATLKQRLAEKGEPVPPRAAPAKPSRRQLLSRLRDSLRISLGYVPKPCPHGESYVCGQCGFIYPKPEKRRSLRKRVAV